MTAADRFSTAMDLVAEAACHGIRVYRRGRELWWESDHRAPCREVLDRLQAFQPEILRLLQPGEIDLAR
ncbi:MAG: hypothetical protein AB1689_15700 [Thermodesulfobacteriota bacterium]